MKDMTNSPASSSLNQVDGGVIHVTDRSHKYNAGWYFRRGAFILLMVMSDKSGWYRAGAPLHGYFPWRRFFIFKSGGQNEFQ